MVHVGCSAILTSLQPLKGLCCIQSSFVTSCCTLLASWGLLLESSDGKGTLCTKPHRSYRINDLLTANVLSARISKNLHWKCIWDLILYEQPEQLHFYACVCWNALILTCHPSAVCRFTHIPSLYFTDPPPHLAYAWQMQYLTLLNNAYFLWRKHISLGNSNQNHWHLRE